MMPLRDDMSIVTSAYKDASRLAFLASFQLAGLDQKPFESLSELAKFNAFVAFAGLRLELPIKNRAATAQASRATLATQPPTHKRTHRRAG